MEHYYAIQSRLYRNRSRQEQATGVAREFYARQVAADEKELAAEVEFLKGRGEWISDDNLYAELTDVT